MLNQAKDLKTQSLFGKICSGIVVFNNDPLNLGRIKVRISALHPSNIPNEDLPWVLPTGILGGINQQGSVNIPDINSKVWILYSSDDVYSGIYLGSLPNTPLELLEDYPNTYGRVDRSGNLLLINTEKDIVQFYHISGTNINIDGSGHTKVQIANYNNPNENAQSLNDVGLTIEVIGDLNIKSSGNMNLECNSFNLKTKNSITTSSTSLTSNSDNIALNSNSSFMASSGGQASIVATGIITATGSAGIFGGAGSTIDGHILQPYQTDVSHTPFIALNPAGVPPSTTIPPASIIKPNDIPEPAPRTRQAFKGDQ